MPTEAEKIYASGLRMFSDKDLQDHMKNTKGVLGKPVKGTEKPGSTASYRSAMCPDLVDGWTDAGIHSIAQIFDEALKMMGPDQPFLHHREKLVDLNGKVTWGPYVAQTRGAVNERRLNFGSGLCQLKMELCGGKEEDKWHFSIFANNRPEWFIADHGAICYGLVSAALFDSLGPESVSYIINHSDSHGLITTIDRIPSALSIAHECPNMKWIISMDELFTTEGKDLVQKAAAVGVKLVSFLEVEQLGKLHRRPVRYAGDDDMYTLCYTSGTTGQPKGGIITHRNMLATGRAIQYQGSGHYQSDFHLSYLPYAHAMERFILVEVLRSGAPVAFGRGDPALIMEDMQTWKPTYVASVPRIWNRLYAAITTRVLSTGGEKGLDAFRKAVAEKAAWTKKTSSVTHPKLDKLFFDAFKPLLGGRVRHAMSGSAPIAPDVLDTLRACFSMTFGEGYGQTESGGAISVQYRFEFDAAYKVGVPLVCNEYKLVSVPEMGYLVTDKPYPRGEVCFRGPNATPGYYKDAKKTADLIDKEGWLHTGDVGEIDEFGRLRILDRTKHIFKLAQGEYVAPEKLENIFQNSAYIAQIYVHGDSVRSELVAVVIPEPEPVLLRAIELGLIPKDVTIPALGVVTPELEKVCKDTKIMEVILKDIEKLGRDRKVMGYELPKAICLKPEIMTIQNGLLTPTNKVKRETVAKEYRPLIDMLYSKVDASRSPAKL
ncbi:hypothetical protein SmJEL517_g04949 [Synchytrium microbalum]|uniref:AMP-dependent synthetase/ligase domain-containing protein n=1 Tax=Synchytrium microbalum TaxID=1806994 RepID=A0A507C1I4_9FUNG|nr:uncharacterized protein SmJEL517_g04949 [Synchytrium microbalum]TPX31806.1 hypothetical protein SmJEL517_g04949 [Synchytrium microbalum]